MKSLLLEQTDALTPSAGQVPSPSMLPSALLLAKTAALQEEEVVAFTCLTAPLSLQQGLSALAGSVSQALCRQGAPWAIGC